MFTKYKNNIEFFHFGNLSAFDNLTQFVSTRKGGSSEPPFDSLNIGLSSGDNPIKVIRNRELVAESLGFDRDNFVFSRQVHGDNIRVIDLDDMLNDKSCRSQPKEAADAMITNVPNFCISVAIADCVPILLYDPDKQVIGVVHSGWKGTVLKIAGKAVQMMTEKFGSDPKSIIAGIGPSIGPESYEVGELVIDEVNKSFRDNNELLQMQDNGKALFDLWNANIAILKEAELSEANIELAGVCTYSSREKFYSYRRDGESFGRMAAGIMLNK